MNEDWKILQSKLKFGSWTDLKGGGKFLGRVMRQSDDRHTVTIDMNIYCQSLHEAEESASMSDEDPVSPEQSSQLRALVGQLGWLAKQGRPDLAFAVSYLQQNLVDATGSTLRLSNATVQKAKQERSLYQRVGMCLEQHHGAGGNRWCIGSYAEREVPIRSLLDAGKPKGTSRSQRGCPYRVAQHFVQESRQELFRC